MWINGPYVNRKWAPRGRSCNSEWVVSKTCPCTPSNERKWNMEREGPKVVTKRWRGLEEGIRGSIELRKVKGRHHVNSFYLHFRFTSNQNHPSSWTLPSSRITMKRSHGRGDWPSDVSYSGHSVEPEVTFPIPRSFEPALVRLTTSVEPERNSKTARCYAAPYISTRSAHSCLSRAASISAELPRDEWLRSVPLVSSSIMGTTWRHFYVT